MFVNSSCVILQFKLYIQIQLNTLMSEDFIELTLTNNQSCAHSYVYNYVVLSLLHFSQVNLINIYLPEEPPLQL